jgi:hypothetical protein
MKKKYFDIQKHLKSHAYLVKELARPTYSDLHFKFSVLDLYFLANNYKAPEEKLKEILDELLQPAEYIITEKNGYYNGRQKIVNRRKKIDLREAVTLAAVHTRGAKGEYTQPHIHLLIKRNTRLGKNYSLLRHHISKTLGKHGLIASFDEINPKFVSKKLSSAVSSFFWQLKQLTDKDFKNYLANNHEKMKTFLDMLYSYTEKTNRLDYFFKTMKILRTRLNKLGLDFEYKGHNIRYSYPIDFILKNPDNQAVIQMLQEKKYAQKDIKPYIDNPILRDAVRYGAIGKKSAYIINEIKHNTDLLDNFKANKKLNENYLKLLQRELPNRPTKTKVKEKGITDYINAFNKALKTAKNEKELREALNKNFDFKFKKRKGKTIGFSFNGQYVSVKELGYKDISEIRAILKRNAGSVAPANEKKPLKTPENANICYKTEKNRNLLTYRRNYYLTKKLNKELLSQIKFYAAKFNQIKAVEQKTQKSDINIPKTPKIVLKPLKINTEGVKNAIRYKQTIIRNIRALKNWFEQFAKLSGRKRTLERKSITIGEQNIKPGELYQSIAERIEQTFSAATAAAAKAIRQFGERAKKLLKPKENLLAKKAELENKIADLTEKLEGIEYFEDYFNDFMADEKTLEEKEREWIQEKQRLCNEIDELKNELFKLENSDEFKKQKREERKKTISEIFREVKQSTKIQKFKKKNLGPKL